MADRYDLERERTGGRQDERSRDFGNERYGERSREFDREHRHDEYGRRREHFGENWGRENFGRENFERENYGRGDWRREPERGDYGTRGDWGRQGSWGTYGNRPDFNREAEWRDYGRRGESEWGGYNTGRTNLYGTGGGGYGSGFSSYGAGSGSYSGGMGSYSGGMGTYGERGRFAGRGPKNWQRSDDRIREDINERLTDHPEIDASEIEVQVKGGEVTLTGIVDERHTKRLAEDVAENVTGVREVHNQLRVQSQNAQQQGTNRSNAVAGGTTTTKHG
jgi:BON domain-containing protein